MKKFLFLLLVSFLSVPYISLAASLQLSSASSVLSPGQILQINCTLDTQAEYINAVEGKIEYPSDLLHLEKIIEGGSIISFWVEKPHLENGQIRFSGIIPGGYSGKNGQLFSLRFSVQAVNDDKIGNMSVKDAIILLNDGLGTETNAIIKNFDFQITSQNSPKSASTTESFPMIIDYEQPEKFSPLLVRNENVFEGKYFVVFATQDKLSGLDHYEILETKKMMQDMKDDEILSPASDGWEIANSPFVLSDQSLKSYIYIKAVDQSGNGRLAVLLPSEHVQWYEKIGFWVIIVGLVVIILGFIFLYKKRV